MFPWEFHGKNPWKNEDVKMGKGGFSWENEDKPWDLWQLLWENEDQRWDVFCDFSWEKSQTKLWDLRDITAGSSTEFAWIHTHPIMGGPYHNFWGY